MVFLDENWRVSKAGKPSRFRKFRVLEKFSIPQYFFSLILCVIYNRYWQNINQNSNKGLLSRLCRICKIIVELISKNNQTPTVEQCNIILAEWMCTSRTFTYFCLVTVII